MKLIITVIFMFFGLTAFSQAQAIKMKHYSWNNPQHHFNEVLTDNGKALLDSINKQGDYRIILTGDHGNRRNGHKENFHYSFTAFKGFDSLALKQIESIQDIGLLINAGFK